jgi:hypothetical protein
MRQITGQIAASPRLQPLVVKGERFGCSLFQETLVFTSFFPNKDWG